MSSEAIAEPPEAAAAELKGGDGSAAKSRRGLVVKSPLGKSDSQPLSGSQEFELAVPCATALVGTSVYYFQQSILVSGLCAFVSGVLCWAALGVERRGLVGMLPQCMSRLMCGSLFDLLTDIINAIAIFSCNILRLVMLACMELTQEQRCEILAEMGPAFRRYVFQKPVISLLPIPLQRLMMGRVPHAPAPLSRATRQARRREPAAADDDDKKHDDDADEADLDARSRPFVRRVSTGSLGSNEDAQPEVLKRSATANLMDIVRGISDVAKNSEGATNIAALEHIIAEKAMGKRVVQGYEVLTNAQEKANQAIDYSRQKYQDVVNDPRTECALESAKVYGATGAQGGGIIGASIGTLVGFVPAIFTFGLSIPIGAAIGGTFGAATGAGVGTGAGLVGGAAYGWRNCDAAKAAGSASESSEVRQERSAASTDASD